MSDILASISDLVSSIFHVITSTLSTIYNIAYDTFSSVFHVLYNVLSTAGKGVADLITGVFDLMSGAVGFVIGNVVILTIIAGGVYGYLQYQKKQGNTVKVGNKKLN